MRLLLAVFLVNVTLLVFGIFISWLDIRLFGAGLYLALVSTVTVVIVLAFCLVGTDESTEPTYAKQMWSKSRQTLRRYTTVRRNESNDLMLYSKQQADSGVAPHKPTTVRYVLPSDQTTSPTPSASTSDPASGSIVQEKQQQCVVQLHSSDHSENDSSAEANSENANTVIYL